MKEVFFFISSGILFKKEIVFIISNYTNSLFLLVFFATFSVFSFSFKKEIFYSLKNFQKSCYYKLVLSTSYFIENNILFKKENITLLSQKHLILLKIFFQLFVFVSHSNNIFFHFCTSYVYYTSAFYSLITY